MSRVSSYQLAQMNLAVPRYHPDDPRMVDFMSALDEINTLADGAPGFVWRLTEDGANNATGLRTALDGVEQLINMSVWQHPEALWDYVYRSGHIDFLRRRGEWFEPPDGPILVLWWIPAGQIPTIDEGTQRLEMLRRDGPTPQAFTFRQRFDPPDR